MIAIGSAVVSSCVTPAPFDENSTVIVKTTSGRVQGIQDHTVAQFRGIPYAAAPSGSLRWRPPTPVNKWSGVRAATKFGPDCIQPTDNKQERLAQSEDCLTLNVASPTHTDHKRKLPVLVNIHGGAFFVGSGRNVFKNGVPKLVDEDVVMVSPNYRVGRMGFFAHPALREEDRALGANGVGFANYWLMDQIAALEWVQDNISNFGGDPNNVTIVGCSAGGSSVNSLVASSKAQGLFDKAIVRSGGGFFNATRKLNVAETQGENFVRRLNLSQDKFAGQSKQAVLDHLRTLTPAEILAGDVGAPNFGAMIDGTYLPAQISTLLAGDSGSHVPLIAGSTSNEASIFGLMGFDKSIMKEKFGIDVDAMRPYYDVNGVLSEKELLRQVQTDFIFTSASLGMASLSAQAGRPSWAYYFDYVASVERGEKPGANHCEDMNYLFASKRFEDDRDEAIAQLLQSQILQFMRTGTPNGEGLVEWPEITAQDMTPLVIGDDVGAVKSFRHEQMKPWFEKWQKETGGAYSVRREQ